MLLLVLLPVLLLMRLLMLLLVALGPLCVRLAAAVPSRLEEEVEQTGGTALGKRCVTRACFVCLCA